MQLSQNHEFESKIPNGFINFMNIIFPEDGLRMYTRTYKYFAVIKCQMNKIFTNKCYICNPRFLSFASLVLSLAAPT